MPAKVSMSVPPPETQLCPTCGRPREARFRPFCSKRCADIDLARWFKGDYAIPVRTTPEGEEEDGSQEENES